MTATAKHWRAKRLILHIGAPRTGSSAIQAMLRANRKALTQGGIQGGTQGGTQGGILFPECLDQTLVAAMAPAWPTDIQQRRIGITGLRPIQRLRRDLASSLRREVNEKQPETIVISAEQFFDRLDKGTVRRRLKHWLTPYADQIDVLVYLRRQDQAIWSRHMNAQRLGRQEAWVTPGRVVALYDYERRLRKWANVFGAGAVIVKPYQRNAFPGGSIQHDFMATAGISPDLVAEPERQHNRSLDTVRAEFLSRITDHIGHKDDPDSMRDDMNWVMDRVQGGWSTATLPKHEAEAILALYADANARLAKRWNDGQAMFDMTLSDTDSDPQSLGVEEVLEIAAQLWNVKAAQVRRLRKRVADLKGSDPG